MIRVLVLLLTLLWSAPAQPQQQREPYGISYRLSMSRPASHLFEVAMDISIPQNGQSTFIDLQMPKWQPGRYAVADFAKNVQEFRARSGDLLLPWSKVDDQTWRIQLQGGRNITAMYRIFGNDLSGTYAQLDVGHANYNGGEIFMYVVGHKQDAVELRIEPPPNWRVINGRSDRLNQLEWRFPNYEILIDNPTEIGPDWTLDEFVVGGKTYRIVVHSRGDEGGRRPALVRDVEKIVRAQVAMWGPPEFDHYTFLYHFAADDRSGDGMEHLTSTQIILPGSLADGGMFEGALDTTSHEFFHVWNVKRLRPAELGPWDWTKPVATRGLFIAEGFTNYYGTLLLHRAGLADDDDVLREYSGTITSIENNPGSKLMSAEDSSMAAPFIDGTLHRQRTNLPNTSVSYYPKGELVGLVLDLLIRGRTKGERSLDDVMRRAYDEFYLKSSNATYYLRGRGYTNSEFFKIVSEITGSDMTSFYTRYVRNPEVLPYDEALGYVGLRLVRTPANQAYTGGIVIDNQDRDTLRLGALRNDSPAERAGLQQGDILLSIGGSSVNRQNWRATLNRYRQGDRVPVRVRRFRRDVELTMQLDGPEIYDYRIEENPNATAEARSLRAAWLNGDRL
ncbi:MAG: M61 family metallopeptidase [Acidobacteria bacterium]|nr:M61 family metallopeptidase [Acidobacteriota bacterium]